MRRPEKGWEAGWAEHERAQMMRLAALPFIEKLKWLEEAQRLAERLAGSASLVSDGKAPPAAFARVVHAGGLEDLDEGMELRRYRQGCLALSPDERVAEARRLSRRMRLANPRNSRSPRIEPVVRLAHDAL